MRPTVAARAWFAATALAVVAALAIQIVLNAVGTDDPLFASPVYRVLNMFVYFTIWSNILVAVTTGRLALGRDVEPLAWRVARLTALVAIVVTFLVYNTVLRGLSELTGAARVTDELFHTIVPIMTVAGWAVFGPRRRTSWGVVWWSLAMPLAWLAFTLVRGPLAGDFYPYPFVDVTELGYGAVALNILGIAVLFVALAAGAHGADRLLSRRSATAAARA